MNIKSHSKEFFLIGILCLSLSACAKNISTCETSINDSIWQTFHGEGISDAVISFRKNGVYEQAVDLLGKPDKIIKNKDAEELIWVVGNRRSSKTFQCGKLTNETYQVSYELTKISLVGGRKAKCNLEVINFIGDKASPDPFTEAPVTSETMGCD